MPIIFYGLKSCDSCRAALKALAAAGIDVDHRDVRDDGVPAETLRQSIEQHGADKVINRRSTTWRELDDKARENEPVALMQAHPPLMKRPLILLADGRTTIGWDAAARNALGLG
jgi:Spx/MgsR family transcriptional regulator